MRSRFTRAVMSATLAGLSHAALAATGPLAIGRGAYDTVSQVVGLADGGLLLAGPRDSGAPWIARLDGDTVTWDALLLGAAAGVTTPPLVAPTSDGGVLVALLPDPADPATAGRPWVARFTAAGAIAWQTSLDLGSGAWPAAVAVARDDSAWILATAGNDAMALVRLQPDGTIAWMRRAEGAGLFSLSGALTALDDGGAALVTGVWPRATRACRLAPDGSAAWCVQLPDGITPFDARAIGSDLKVSARLASVEGAPAVGVVRVALADGSEASFLGIPLGMPLSDRLAPQATVLEDGGFAASFAHPTLAQAQVIARVDASGGVTWSRRVSDWDWREAFRLAALPAGRLAIAGAWPGTRTGFGVPGAVRWPQAGVGDGSAAWAATLDASGVPEGGCDGGAASVTVGRAVALPVTRLALDWVTVGTTQSVATLAPTAAAMRAMRTCVPPDCRADASELAACGEARLDLAAADAQLNFCDDAEDWLDVRSCAGSTITLATSDLGALADTVLELWSPDCSTLLGIDDDGGGARASLLTVTLPTEETYRVVVRQKDGSTGPDRGYRVAMARPSCSAPAWFARVEWPGTRSLGVGGIAMTSSGDLVVASGPSEASHSTVMRIDRAGSLEQAVTWTASSGAIDWITAAPDGDGALLGGRCEFELDGTIQACLHRFDAAGAMTWSTHFGSSRAGESIWLARVLPAGSGALAWGHAFTESGGRRGLVVRLDAAGDVTWAVGLPRVGYGQLQASPLADGGALILGLIEHGFGMPRSGWMARLDSAGAVTWEHELVHATDLVGGVGGIALNAAEDALIGVRLWDAAFRTRWIALATVDAGGTLAPRRELAEDMEADWTAPCPDGGLFSILSAPTYDGSFAVLRTDAAGTPIVQRGSGGWALGQDLFGVTCATDGVAAAWTQLSSMVMEISRLPPDARLATACDRTSPTTLPERAPGLAFTGASETVESFGTARIVPELSSRAATPQVLTACSTEPCEPLSLSIIGTDPPTPCVEGEARLILATTGRLPMVVEVDLDYDGVTFDTDTLSTILPIEGATPRTIAVRVTDSCPWGRRQAIATFLLAPEWCNWPGEVSGSRSPSVLMSGAEPTRISFSTATHAAAYNVIVGSIGSFGAPILAASRCHQQPSMADAARLGLVTSLPSNCWVRVTASNPLAEGIAGADSLGAEASRQRTWRGCGPSP